MEVLERPRQKKKRKFERRSKDRLRPLEMTPRIDRILLLLAEYRLLTSSQIAELLAVEGYNRQRTGRVLSTLYDHRMLDKPEEQVRVRHRLGAGGRPDIYALGDEGAKYLEEKFGVPRSAARFRDKNRAVRYPYIEHALLVSEIMLAFERSVARRGDVRLVYPREALERAPEETRSARRPFQWRARAVWEGAELKVTVNPDFKVFGIEFLSLPAPENVAWFMLEGDVGTETVIPENLKNTSKPTLFHKFLGYHTTWTKRYHQARFGIRSFRVLTVTARRGVQVSRDPRTGERVERTRVASLQAAARLVTGGDKTADAFFLFADLATLAGHEDVLRMPWATAHPRRTATLDLAR